MTRYTDKFRIDNGLFKSIKEDQALTGSYGFETPQERKKSKQTATLDSKLIRGQRVKSVRLMAGLSRHEIQTKYGLSASTIQSWEDGKVGGLTKKGAKRIVDIATKTGIVVTSDYLMDGIGNKPAFAEQKIFHFENEEFVVNIRLK